MCGQSQFGMCLFEDGYMCEKKEKKIQTNKTHNYSNIFECLYAVLLYADRGKNPGKLLMIDLEKAFDSVAWSFIQKAVRLVQLWS